MRSDRAGRIRRTKNQIVPYVRLYSTCRFADAPAQGGGKENAE